MGEIHHRRRWSRWAAVGALAALMTGHSALASWQREHALMVNTSESLPNWAFFVEKNAVPRREQYVFFLPPRTPLLVRHFGERPGSFGKQVLGLPGRVCNLKCDMGKCLHCPQSSSACA